MNKQKEKGFTLLELSLVILVASALISGALFAYGKISKEPDEMQLSVNVNDLILKVKDVAILEDSHANINFAVVRDFALLGNEFFIDSGGGYLLAYNRVRVYVTPMGIFAGGGFLSTDGTQLILRNLTQGECQMLVRNTHFDAIYINGLIYKPLNGVVNYTKAIAACHSNSDFVGAIL